MDAPSLLRRLERQAAEPAIANDASSAVEAQSSVSYLASDEALESLRADVYWPKWDSPWWHLLLLHERGQAALIPRRTVDALVEGLERLPVKSFPIQPHELQGVDPIRDVMCHCALGCIVPVLLSSGVDVDARLPWVRDWFGRYQLADGGLNCDADAYLVREEVPSSMVGTVAPLEAMLAWTAHRPRPEDERFMDRAAAFLIGRGLVRGSDTAHNAAERNSAREWGALCFPRFYFYDVLRGLTALVDWAHRLRRPLPWHVIEPVVRELDARFPDGRLRIERRPFADKGTRLAGEDGAWTKRAPASTFPLLEASSQLGSASPSLASAWRRTCLQLGALARSGLLGELA